MATPQLGGGVDWGSDDPDRFMRDDTQVSVDEDDEGDTDDDPDINLLSFGPFDATIDWDEEAEIYHGQIVNIKDIITFNGNTRAEALQAMKDSVYDYLDFVGVKKMPPDAGGQSQDIA